MSLLTAKEKVRVGTWNVRTMYETGKTAHVPNEMKRYGIEVLGICESRWNGSGLSKLSTGETMIYSGRPENNHEHIDVMTIMMSPIVTKALMH